MACLGFLLLRVLHQFDQVGEEDVPVAFAEAVHFVAHFARVVVDGEAGLPRLEVLMGAHAGRGAQFLWTIKQQNGEESKVG